MVTQIIISLSFVFRLRKEFESDPWITYRFRKYMAGPKRWPWKNQREIKRSYQFTFLTNAALGFILTWPLGVIIGRRMTRFQGGVPIVPYQRFVHDFPNLDPGRLPRNMFRWYFFLTCTIGGLAFAVYTTDTRQMVNRWYNRTDLKPYPAMVPGNDELDITEKTARAAHMNSFRHKM